MSIETKDGYILVSEEKLKGVLISNCTIPNLTITNNLVKKNTKLARNIFTNIDLVSNYITGKLKEKGNVIDKNGQKHIKMLIRKR